ncbi:MAG: hypothetical protein WBS20_01215 [Lysobacterales bacterium]
MIDSQVAGRVFLVSGQHQYLVIVPDPIIDQTDSTSLAPARNTPTQFAAPVAVTNQISRGWQPGQKLLHLQIRIIGNQIFYLAGEYRGFYKHHANGTPLGYGYQGDSKDDFAEIDLNLSSAQSEPGRAG